MQYGVYVHPLWLFRKNHGSEWEFSVGDGPDDDLPMPLRMTCQQSSILIYQLLSQSTMFPPGSSLHDIVANCYGNGLKALKAILLRSHPSFVDEPSTLVTTYPKQKGQVAFGVQNGSGGFSTDACHRSRTRKRARQSG